MATHDNSTSRRALILGLAGTPFLAGTIAATISTSAEAATTSRSAWDQALAAYQDARARLDTAYAAWDAATEAASDETPERPDDLFDRYGLNLSMDRAEIVRTLGWSIPGAENAAKVEAKADQFAAFQRKAMAAHAKHRTDALWEHARTTNPRFDETRDALMAIPAPDIAALLIKIEIAGVSLDDEHGEAMITDARRLLSHGRA